MARALPSDEPVLHYRELGAVPILGTGPGERIEWERRPFREKTRIVCHGCNAGWMSRLEDAAAPILTPLINHEPAYLGSKKQAILAAWAVKTCLVFQASQGAAIAPPEHFAALRETSLPPHGVTAWIGSNYHGREIRDNAYYLQRPLSLKSLDDRLSDVDELGYVNYLAIGAVSFLIIGHGYANTIDVELGDNPIAEGLDQTWPIDRSLVTWPPKYMMAQEFVDLLAGPTVGRLTARVHPPDA
jgi:hypothetical protein